MSFQSNGALLLGERLNAHNLLRQNNGSPSSSSISNGSLPILKRLQRLSSRLKFNVNHVRSGAVTCSEGLENMFSESSPSHWAVLQLQCCPSTQGQLPENIQNKLLPQTVVDISKNGRPVPHISIKPCVHLQAREVQADTAATAADDVRVWTSSRDAFHFNFCDKDKVRICMG